MQLTKNLSDIVFAMQEAAHKRSRDPSALTLVAVSKTHPVEVLQEYESAAADKGVRVVFGENYLQEIKSK